ncbi:hypothetical protein BJ741DRAFT_216953 [Chytriomyces cf. hyalinus JEL632]|nr:hypothetical protein BJ741DRAFT_216953 [Chytriomyces cf. hyalinus JEL632]
MSATTAAILVLLQARIFCSAAATEQLSNANLTSTLTAIAPLPSGAVPINWTRAELSKSLYSSFSTNQDIGQCVCDLTSNECDPNCCCDPDCASIQAFLSPSQCTNQAADASTVRMCSGLLKMVNPLADTNLNSYRDTDTSQLCVIINNSPIQGFFYADPGKQYQRDSFFAAQIQMKPFTFSIDQYDVVSVLPVTSGTVQPSIFAQNYSVGDLLVVAYDETPAFGVFPLPEPSVSGECNDAGAARFLISGSNSCLRQIPLGAAADLCRTSSFFDVSYYLKGFQLVMNLGARLSLENVTCINPLSGSSTPCKAIKPTWNSTASTCDNVLTDLRFIFSFTNSDGGISIGNVRVEASFSMFVLPQLPRAVLQTFSISWVQGNTKPIPKSGNPGYLIGKPILFGSFITQPIPAVAYFPAKADTFSLPMDVYSGGVITCGATPSNRLGLNFGEDVETGCTLYFNWNEFKDCVNMRKIVYSAVTGGSPGSSKIELINAVGKFGNSSAEVIDEWVPVISTDLGDSSQPSTNAGTCSSILTEINVEFITAKLGLNTNPQSAIIAARVTRTWGSFSYRCITPNDCRSVDGVLQSTKQKFRVRAAVSFLDIGQAPQAFAPPAPRLVPLLPDDIFYPFSLPS